MEEGRGVSWLFMLLCVAAGCAGSDPRPADDRDAPGWLTEITAESGLDFVHENGGTGELHTPEVMGGGAALFDFDNDGDLDIYLTNGNRALLDPSAEPDAHNRLYRRESDGHYVDVSAASGLDDRGYGMGVAIGDFDNDGDADVYVTNHGPDHLYRNKGDGTFRDITAMAGIEVDTWSSSAVFFDYDRDGYLDLYVAQYVVYDPRANCSTDTGRADYCGPREFPPVPDVLLHNNGDGTFSDVSAQAGMTGIAAAGLGVVCEDLNDDGWPDVYVANDGYTNQLWINDGGSTFHDEAFLLGVAANLHGQSEAGMGIIAADLDNDERLDLFMTHLAQETNTLYRNLGPAGGFRDATGESGLGPSSMRYTGFGTAALDVDLDGDLDLAIANGRVKYGTVVPRAEPPPPWDVLAEPNLFYLNDGSGSFALAGSPCASFCDRVEITRGLVIGDIDSDGDADILVSNIRGEARLYRNDAPRQGHWLEVRAVDPRYNRAAIGARVTVHVGQRKLVRTISRGFSYLSSREPVARFGLGTAERVDRIEVRWPDGLSEVFSDVAADRAVVLTRGTGVAGG